jgi:hypothetical protein
MNNGIFAVMIGLLGLAMGVIVGILSYAWYAARGGYPWRDELQAGQAGETGQMYDPALFGPHARRPSALRDMALAFVPSRASVLPDGMLLAPSAPPSVAIYQQVQMERALEEGREARRAQESQAQAEQGPTNAQGQGARDWQSVQEIGPFPAPHPADLPREPKQRERVQTRLAEVNRPADSFVDLATWEHVHGPARMAVPVMRYTWRALEEAPSGEPQPLDPVAWWAMYIRARVWIGLHAGVRNAVSHQQMSVPALVWPHVQPVLRALGIAWRKGQGVKQNPDTGEWYLLGDTEDTVRRDFWMVDAPPLWAKHGVQESDLA